MHTGKFFTPAARQAALEGRRKTLLQRQTAFGQMEVFAVRRGSGLSWEIRRFGGVTLVCGTECFKTVRDAVEAGELTRRAMFLPA